MAAQSLAVMAAQPAHVPSGAVRCDQAVFTSVRTSTGQGYRIIAASPGLTPEEKNEISARSPSHGGLCGSDEGARGVAFNALKSGRLCAALSSTAGREQTGRGGLRIFTRAVVFAADDLARFGHNPFRVLRAMEAQGLDQPELNLPQTLPVTQLLPAQALRHATPLSELRDISLSWLSFLLRGAMTGRAVILAANEGVEGVAEGALETVVSAVPGALRRKISFSRGLKFSIGRPFTLSEVSGDTAATERIIHGHPITLVRPTGTSTPPRGEAGDWERMAETYWAAGEFAELEVFASQDFPDVSRAALDRIAALRIEAREASAASGVDCLLTLADRRLRVPERREMESRLLADLLSVIRTRLDQLWSSAAQAELAAAWIRVRALMQDCSAGSAFTTELAGLVLRKLAALNPPLALEHSLALASAPSRGVISNDLSAVLGSVERWSADAPPAELRPVAESLKRWRQAYPYIEHAGIVMERVTERAKY